MSVLTLFACPKPFFGHDAIIQYNALDNWKVLGLPVILVGDDAGVSGAAKKYGYGYIPNIARTPLGTPLLSDIFSKAQTVAKTPLVGYVNADIIFSESLLSAAALAQEKFTFFLMTGQRWDVDIAERIEFSGDWDAKLEAIRKNHGVLHGRYAMDYFIFPRGMVEMPHFAIGRPTWDNWLICSVLHGRGDVIDATEAICALHQNHEYAHVPGRVTKNWEMSPEALENRELAKALFPKKNYLHETIKVAHWILTDRLVFKYNRLRWARKMYYSRAMKFLFAILKSVFLAGFGEKRYSEVKSKFHSIFGKI
jgi:hypothetical protein